MYASDITNRKRAQVIYSDVVKQKDMFSKGLISRMTYQSGGTDYSYMMELEQGCVNNTCIGKAPFNTSSGNATTIMDTTYATYINPLGPPQLVEYGYRIYVDANGNSIIGVQDASGNLTYTMKSNTGTTLQTGLVTMPPFSYLTCDDVYLPFSIGSMNFNFFGTNYANRTLFWSSNNAILFSNPLRRMSSVSASPYPSILLGNGDRRLDKLYVRDDSIQGAYSIITLLVFYEAFTNQLFANPNTGVYQVRLIRELTGFNRQWIEVRIKVKPYTINGNETPGYIAGQLDTDGNAVDSTKISPFNVTDGSIFYNPCGTTFSTVGPAVGSSFTFEGTSDGYNWIFRNNTSLPI